MVMTSSSLQARITIDSADSDLALAASKSHSGAFEELYRRHSAAALRVARSVTGNSDDAADAVAEAFTRVLDALPRLNGPRKAFRSYLLTTTRRAAHDLVRAGRRVVTSAEPADLMCPVTTGASDPVVAQEDSATVAQAFDTLPERWQAVLWLTDVEGCAPQDAAGLLGLTANNVSQLATRARARLRAGYLQAHVSKDASDGCRPTAGKIGAYVADTLAAGQASNMRNHLAVCTDCAGQVDELTDGGPVSLFRWRRGVRPR